MGHQVPASLVDALSGPFAEQHQAGIVLELNRDSTLGSGPAVRDFVLGIEKASLNSDYRRLKLAKVWFQESDNASVQNAAHTVPFVPHIDGARYFKVMVYVSDVRIQDGPMHIASQPPDGMEFRRLRFGEDYKEQGLNQVQDLPLQCLEPLTGMRGSVVLFDTNTPHCAGTIAEGGQRRLVRFDFNCTGWSNHQVVGTSRWRMLARRVLGTTSPRRMSSSA